MFAGRCLFVNELVNYLVCLFVCVWLLLACGISFLLLVAAESGMLCVVSGVLCV